MLVNNGGYYTKHVYLGSQRIVSKLASSDIFNVSPVNTTDLKLKYTQLTSKIKERYDSLGVNYKGTEVTGGTGLISKTPLGAGGLYYYHSDHLGSSSLISDAVGGLVQHLEYMPFGEVFLDERASLWSTRYRFNAKELDEETGLYYYVARYLDPRLSIWLSVDPLALMFPNVSSYVYCHNNPTNRIDKDGRADENTSGKRSEINKTNGTYTAAQSSLRSIEPKEQITPQKTLNPNNGEIKPADVLTTAEMWLNSPSTSKVEMVEKIVANIGYGIVNSPFSLLTGQSIGGTPLNSAEKQEAFIDVAPGLLSGGLTKTGAVVKTTEKGLKGFNQFVKSTEAATAKGLPAGMSWQKNAGELFKANSVSQGGLKSLDASLKITGGASVIKKEANK